MVSYLVLLYLSNRQTILKKNPSVVVPIFSMPKSIALSLQIVLDLCQYKSKAI